VNEYLFSYGTLQEEKVQIELFGRNLQGSKDILRGYRAATIEIKDESFLSNAEQQYHLIAIPSTNKNDNIRGTIFEISREELLLADKYEPEEYKRINVILESGKEAWIYVAVKTD
jgi:gamma-glutamylcyclotransferase (GGCT)/AIG2-like uncharacterized protein YtfP